MRRLEEDDEHGGELCFNMKSFVFFGGRLNYYYYYFLSREGGDATAALGDRVEKSKGDCEALSGLDGEL